MGGATTPKGGSTLTTTQNQQVPSYVSDAQQNLLNAGNSVLSPFIQQQSYTQAATNADQSGAYDLTRNLAQSAFGGQTAADQITNAYQTSAGRAPEAGITSQWVDAINKGDMSLQDALSQIRNGDEAQAYRTAHPTQGTTTASGITLPNAPTLSNFQDNDNWKATSQGYNASTYNPATYGAQGYNASTYDPSLASASKVSGSDISALMNSYQSDVVNTTLDQMRRQYGETQAAQNAKSAASGSFGGSRQALQSAQLDRSFGDQVASTTANLMAAGYDKATATALANAQMSQQTTLSNQSAQNTAGQFNAGVKNTADQFLANASNTAGQFNANSQNTAGQFNAGAQNTAAQFGASAANNASLANASQFSSLLNNQNANKLSMYGQQMSSAQIQDAMNSSDQTRKLAAIQALLGTGNAQYQTAQSNISTPLQYLQLLQGITPTNYGGTTTTNAPNTAASPLQNILGGGLSLLGLKTSGGGSVGANLLGF